MGAPLAATNSGTARSTDLDSKILFPEELQYPDPEFADGTDSGKWRRAMQESF